MAQEMYVKAKIISNNPSPKFSSSHGSSRRERSSSEVLFVVCPVLLQRLACDYAWVIRNHHEDVIITAGAVSSCTHGVILIWGVATAVCIHVINTARTLTESSVLNRRYQTSTMCLHWSRNLSTTIKTRLQTWSLGGGVTLASIHLRLRISPFGELAHSTDRSRIKNGARWTTYWMDKEGGRCKGRLIHGYRCRTEHSPLVWVHRWDVHTRRKVWGPWISFWFYHGLTLAILHQLAVVISHRINVLGNLQIEVVVVYIKARWRRVMEILWPLVSVTYDSIRAMLSCISRRCFGKEKIADTESMACTC